MCGIIGVSLNENALQEQGVSRSSIVKQLGMFNDSTIQPVPLMVADKWGFALQHHVIGDDYWYALQDWVYGVLEGQITSKTMSDVRHGVLGLVKMTYCATDGKTYKRDYAQEQVLYEITRRLRPTKNRVVLIAIQSLIHDVGLMNRLSKDSPCAINELQQIAQESKPSQITSAGSPEIRYAHPALKSVIVAGGFTNIVHEYSFVGGRVDFVATDSDDTTWLFECKWNCSSDGVRECRQLVDYAYLWGRDCRLCLAAPEDVCSEELERNCAIRNIHLIKLPARAKLVPNRS